MVALEKITIKVLPQNLFDLMSKPLLWRVSSGDNLGIGFVKLKHPSANQLYQKWKQLV